jgi:hypothetical protein
MYKYKLKEIEIGDTEIRGGKKSTVSAIDDATGRIEWDIVDAADFSSVYKALSKANDFLSALEKEGKAKDDIVIDGFAEDIAKLFNAFRTHVRKNYPKEYERVSRLKESVNEGHGLDQGDLDYLQFIADKNPDDTKLEKIIKFLSDSNILVDKTKDLSKGKEVEEGTFHGPREIAIYDGRDGETYIEKRGLGYYGYNDSFDFTAEDKAELKHKLNSWGYRLVAGSIDEGEGIGYLTPNAFGKKKKNIYTSQYGYKLVPKKVKGSGLEVKQLFEKTDRNEFQAKRIAAFDEVEERFNNISKLISNAKNETAQYYNENPGSYAVVYSTDYIFELLEEIEAKLTNNPE